MLFFVEGCDSNMAVELSRLIKKVSHMDISIIAGANGLSNMVTWVHMVEAREATPFLVGGEITFTTGIGLNNSFTILDLVQNIWSQNAAGAIFNTGPFLENVPQEVIDFGNEHNFPLFIVPWKIHIAEMIRIFCFAITKSEQASLEIAAAFKNAIFYPEHEELYVVPLSRYDFHVNWNYYVCAIKVTDQLNKPLPVNRLDSICTSLDNFLQHRRYKNYAMFHHEHQLLIVLGNYNEPELSEFIKTTRAQLSLYCTPNNQIHIGIGKSTKSIRCLYKSYRQAIAIQTLQENNKINKSLISYTNMGIYKLLMGIDDKEILQEYYEKTIFPLEEYDRQNGSDFAVVLRSYLNHDGSIKDTADELFVHRNTVNYKLNKASELIHMDLSKLETRLQLLIGFMLKDMF